MKTTQTLLLATFAVLLVVASAGIENCASSIAFSGGCDYSSCANTCADILAGMAGGCPGCTTRGDCLPDNNGVPNRCRCTVCTPERHHGATEPLQH